MGFRATLKHNPNNNLNLGEPR